jgi:mRNA interferase MazF
MERFVKGDVVVMPFPFSDLSSLIKRPALVVANLQGEDIILCEITSKERIYSENIKLSKKDFKKGNLKVESFIRPERLFTLRKSIILYKTAVINQKKIKEVENKLCEIFTQN